MTRFGNQPSLPNRLTSGVVMAAVQVFRFHRAQIYQQCDINSHFHSNKQINTTPVQCRQISLLIALIFEVVSGFPDEKTLFENGQNTLVLVLVSVLIIVCGFT